MARTYTAEQRARALDLYAKDGPAAAARATAIPPATIRSWAKRSGAQPLRDERTRAGTEAARLTWEQRRAELTVRLGEVAADLLERAATGEAQEAKALMTATAIAIDKAQLLTGRATAREERVGPVTPDEARRELELLEDELAARRDARDAATQPPAPARMVT
jgi:hypothetical protein